MIHRFSRILNTEFDKEGSVVDFLSTQFTVNYDDGSFGFLFYKDKGVEWRPLDEAKKTKGRTKADFEAKLADILAASDESIDAAEEALTSLETPTEYIPEEPS